MVMRIDKTRVERDIAGDDVYWERAIHPEHMLAVRQNLLPAEMAVRVAEIFSVLGDPTRLQVVYALLSSPTGELCVCDLASGMGRDDTTISHQLRVLRNHKIVSMRKVGRVVYYRLIDEHVRQLLQLGMEHASEPAESGEGSATPLISTLKEAGVPL